MDLLNPQPDIIRRSCTPEEIAAVARTTRQRLMLFDVSRQRSAVPEHSGPLSLKMVLSGSGHYRFDRQHYSVQPGQILVVPPEVRLGAEFSPSTHVVAAYLTEAALLRAMSDCTRSTERMLECPEEQWDGPFEFPPHLRLDRSNIATALHAYAASGNELVEDEWLSVVANLAAQFVLDARGATRRISAARPAARRELFRRVCIARARIEADPLSSGSLSELASSAALSSFHLLRTFCQAFGETPAQMRRRLLIDHAKVLLCELDRPVGEVAAAVGFESHAAFSRAFRRETGYAPTMFRSRAARP
jgi:AraC family transcriptional regulator